MTHPVQKVRHDKRGTRSVVYQFELIRCGKVGCRCSVAAGNNRHGPYWFAYWNERTGRKRKRYIGVELTFLTFEQLRATERSEARKQVRRAKREQLGR